MKLRIVFFAIICSVFLFSCQNRYHRPVPSGSTSTNQGNSSFGITTSNSYQVAKSEYERNFQSRYGLLFLKSSDVPFSGRILTIDTGESGEYVQSDEQWREGRKHGVSAKWFSNGIKMFERNYQDGKWHGTVTRWWPNGQKMYVRGYTNGVRHGKEITWRSDGTPLSIPHSSVPESVKKLGTTPSADTLSTVEEPDVLPTIDLPGFSDELVVEPQFQEAPMITADEQPALAEGEKENSSAPFPSFDPIDEPAFPQLDDSSELPLDAALDETAFPAADLGDLPSNNPPDVGFPELTNGGETADEMPEVAGESFSGLPELPDLAAESDEELPSLPALDGIGGDEELPGLPPLPGGAGDDSLPPLPTVDGGLDDLPLASSPLKVYSFGFFWVMGLERYPKLV